VFLNSGTADTVTLSFSKFTESYSLGCLVSAVVLTDAGGAAFSGLPAPTFDAATRAYTIDIDTSTLTSFVFKIAATAQGGSSASSPLITVNVKCGSEMVTMLTNTDYLVYNLGSSYSEDINAKWYGFWSSDKT